MDWNIIKQHSLLFLFLLLLLRETLYSEYDKIARRRKVFKVETIGDCYVAVAGVPKQCQDHHIIMCRFANECLEVSVFHLKTRENFKHGYHHISHLSFFNRYLQRRCMNLK